MQTEDLELTLRGLRDPQERGDDRIVVLVKAVRAGRIDALECRMPTCVCPDGRGHFTRRGEPHNGPWGPSADRWPVAGRDGGAYAADNVRLAHRRCNQAEGGYWGESAGKGVRHVLSPEARASLVLNGQRVGALMRTPDERERMRERGRVMGRVGGSKGGPARARRAATPEGRAALLRLLEMGRQSTEQLSANARKANCVRWGIGRGKPCTCGTHQCGPLMGPSGEGPAT